MSALSAGPKRYVSTFRIGGARRWTVVVVGRGGKRAPRTGLLQDLNLALGAFRQVDTETAIEDIPVWDGENERFITWPEAVAAYGSET